MNRQKKVTLLLLGGAVVLAVGALLLLDGWGRIQTAKEDAGYPVAQLQADDMTAISYLDGTGTAVQLKKKDGSWQWAEDIRFPLDQSYPAAMLSAVSTVTASRVIEAPKDLGQYGLTAPMNVIKLTDISGAETTFSLGSANDLAQGTYLTVSGSDAVYVVSGDILTAFTATVEEMVQMEPVPSFTVDQGSNLSITTAAGSLDLRRRSDPASQSYTDAYRWKDAQDDWVEESEVAALLTSITTLQWGRCVSWSAQDLAQYGLDAPSATITVTYQQGEESREFTLLLGASCEDGYYARIFGSSMVYTISQETAERFLTAPTADLRPKRALSFNWDYVDGVTYTSGTASQTLSVAREGAQDGEGTAAVREAYQLDGVAVDETLVQNWQRACDALPILSRETTVPEQDADATFTIALNTVAQRTTTVRLWLDEGEGAVFSQDDGTPLLIQREAAQAMRDSWLELSAMDP